MVQDGSASKSVVLWTQADVESQFAAGKAAMMENGPWNIALLQGPLGSALGERAASHAGGRAEARRAAGRRDVHRSATGDSAKMAAAGKIVACVNSDANQVAISNRALIGRCLISGTLVAALSGTRNRFDDAHGAVRVVESLVGDAPDVCLRDLSMRSTERNSSRQSP